VASGFSFAMWDRIAGAQGGGESSITATIFLGVSYGRSEVYFDPGYRAAKGSARHSGLQARSWRTFRVGSLRQDLCGQLLQQYRPDKDYEWVDMT